MHLKNNITECFFIITESVFFYISSGNDEQC